MLRRQVPHGRGWISLLAVGALIVAACSGDGDEGSAPTEATTSDEAAGGADEGAATADLPETTSIPTTSSTPPTTSSTPPTTEPTPPAAEDRSFFVLPPGNYGGLPTNENSLDQLPLYTGLSPLRDDIGDTDLEAFFVPMDFEPVGETRIEETGRDGLTITYDEFGIPHIEGETRDDLAFGAGWVTARDRALLLRLGRGPARVAVADIPNVDAFSLVTSATPFVPSEATEQLVTDQVELLRETYGDVGEEIIAEAQAYVDGINAYAEANDIDQEPFTVNDVVAVTAFIGSIFGAGGGSEGRNAAFLSELQAALGPELGRQVWEDVMPTDDPEAPTTIEERFEYPALTGGEVTGSVVIDAGSATAVDIGLEPAGFAPTASRSAIDGPVTRQASNWLLVDPAGSADSTTLAVMGPQLGYYYPEIVQQVAFSGAGIEAQGAVVPGLAMYLLIGRTTDYAWSLTSANQDVRDTFVEVLCEPDGSEPTVESQHYEFEGECIAFEQFDAGTLGGAPISYPTSVHGPVIATATADGRPVALTTARTTFGRDVLNLAALKGMTEGEADTPEAFIEVADRFGFTFNWGYANRDSIAYFASGDLPVRAEGLDRRLPTLGTGEYEWQGRLEPDQHPQAIGGADDRLLNWNNQSAPGFMHGDNNQYGSAHRVENFDQWPDPVDLEGVVGVMNRAATEDVRSGVWPVVSNVLAGGTPPSAIAGDAVALLDDWIAADAPLIDADDDGIFDDAGPLVFEIVFDAVVGAVREPVLGPADAAGVQFVGIDDASFVDKDLRSVAGEPVEGPFGVQYCGAGELDRCRADLWAAIDAALTEEIAERGDDVTTWFGEGDRTTFQPGLLPDDFASTNRPTYQQVIEFAAAR